MYNRVKAALYTVKLSLHNVIRSYNALSFDGNPPRKLADFRRGTAAWRANLEESSCWDSIAYSTTQGVFDENENRYNFNVMTTTPTKTLTFEEYLSHDDGTDNRYELDDGELFLMNPPTVKHTLIIKFLEKTLDAKIERLSLPWLALRDTGVRTGVKNSKLPDLAVFTTEQAASLMNQSAVFQVPPLLAVEVVSLESIKRDYRLKRTQYAALSIPEYWIVDPLEFKTTVLTLVEGFYDAAEFKGSDRIISFIFPNLTLTAEQILLN